MASAIKTNPYLIIWKQFNEKLKSHFNENYFYCYLWDVFDNKGQAANINERNWIVNSILEEVQRGNYPNKFYIADPNGKIELHTFSGKLGGIINCINFIREINKFDNWNHYNLCIENERLKKENAELKEKLLNENIN